MQDRIVVGALPSTFEQWSAVKRIRNTPRVTSLRCGGFI
jgi:hypothetical protein